ncbi:TonB-dependent receptor [Labilibacter sediminis]|nr:TonB-dependent receptor [Labilibacter sediminis]
MTGRKWILAFSIIVLLAFQELHAQSNKIDLNLKRATLKEFFREIERQSDYSIFYKEKILDNSKELNVTYTDKDVKKILDDVLIKYNLKYQIKNKLILITPLNTGANKRSQNNRIEIKGIVKDHKGDLLPGVNILLKGTDRGTITNLNGQFRLLVDNLKASLVISFLGFETKEIKLKGRRNVNITLKESSIGIDEVIAIGYGVVKKSDLTGSVTSIKPAQIQESPYASIDQGLVGLAAGVNVSQASGMPGATARIRIRGISSIEGGNEPLFVIDGFPIYNGGGFGNTGGNVKLSGLSFFNPSDIESIEILKDASATSIYGARASNGVVLIETMQPDIGPDKVVVDSYFGVQSVVKKLDLMNAAQYAELVNEVQENEGLNPIYDEDQLELIRKNPKGTDWQGELYRLAPVRNHQIRFSGGFWKTRYVVSANYYNQEGIIKNSGYNRLSARINLDRTMRNNLRVGTYTTISYGKYDNVRTNTNAGSRGVVNAALKMNPILPVYQDKEQGLYTPSNSPGTDYPNPIATVNEQVLENKTVRLLVNAFAEWDIRADLKAKFTIGGDLFVNKNDAYTPSTIYESNNGSAAIRTDLGFNWLNENTITWNKTINDIHDLLFLAGITFQENKEEGVLASAEGFINDELGKNNIGSGQIYNQPQSGNSRWGLISYLGRINYDFANKLLVTYNMRVDGSSRFSGKNKYAFFPSGAIGWRLIEEDFISDLNVFSNLKARLSYGITGNQEIGLYSSLATLTDNSYTFGRDNVTGFFPDKISNPDLKWEKTAQLNVGLDVGFVNNKLTFTTDWYYKKTTDLIFGTSIPLITGFETTVDNIGSIENKGLELEVLANIVNRRFRWQSGLNLAFNRSKVLDLGRVSYADVEPSADLFKTGSVHRLMVGQPVGIFYGYKFDGIFQNENEVNAGSEGPTNWVGGQRYKDLSGEGNVPDGVIDAIYDRTIIGNPNPKFHGGLTNTLFFEGVELNLFCQFSYGNDILNYNTIELEQPSGGNNVYADLVNRWKPEKPSNIYPKASSNRTVLFNDRHVEDGSYFKIKTVTLSYDFPKLQIKRLDRLKVYLTGHNLFTFTSYSGYDPEVSYKGASNLEMGEDFGGYPPARSIILGVKLTLR